MTTAPVLSILVVCKNDAERLSFTLDSIFSQVASPDLFEVLVQDAASTDLTPELVAHMENRGVRWVSEADNGIYDGMNKALARARGRFVQFLNTGDGYVDQSALSSLLTFLRPLDESARWVVVGALDLSQPTRPMLIGNVPHHWLRHAYGFQDHCHQATVVSREVLELLGGHSESFGFAGDFDLVLRLGLIVPPRVLPTPIVTYEGNGISALRRQEIPRLRHRVRATRMQMGSVPSALDWSFERINWARVESIRWLRRTRHRLAARAHD